MAHTEEQKRQLAELDREYKKKKAKILRVKGPAITTPENPAWTVELIERLKKYIDASRYFEVSYRENKIFGMDFVPEEHNDRYAPDFAEFYLQEFDDARPEGHCLNECHPSDFRVSLLKPVEDWQSHNPNWSEADPDNWAEYQKFLDASED